MRWLKNLILILIGGYLGLISWVVWGGATGCVWWYAGEVSAIFTCVVVGKITTPLWVVGMTYESSNRWPLIGRILNGFKPWWHLHYPTVIGAAVVISGFAGILYLCWPQ